MTILLGGEKLPGYDHRVKVQGKIECKDLGREGSNTAGSHVEWKPWILQVRLKINFDGGGGLLDLCDPGGRRDLLEGLDGQPVQPGNVQAGRAAGRREPSGRPGACVPYLARLRPGVVVEDSVAFMVQ